MAHIDTQNQEIGIRSLLMYKPSTGEAMLHLAQALLHGPSPISKRDRELIAAYTSKLNQCKFCYQSHRAAALAHSEDATAAAAIIDHPQSASIDPKLKMYFYIAEKVQQSGRHLTKEDITSLKDQGLSDEEIHDAVLIVSAFCMYNRYVDGLGATTPQQEEDYIQMGKRMAEMGYERKQ